MGRRGLDAASLAVSIVAMMIGILSLVVSVLVVLNGSASQARFESDRSRCLDNMSEFAKQLYLVQYRPTLDADVIAGYLTSIAAARGSCFTPELLDGQADLGIAFAEQEETLNAALVVVQLDGDLRTPSGDAIREAANNLIAIANTAKKSVGNAAGPGLWPWEQPQPLRPSAPSPSASPSL